MGWVTITNNIGIYSFVSVIVLFIFYLMRPKPFKKIIPSIIFLEKSSKRQNLSSFFKKIVKDWLFLLQLLIVLIMCLSTLGLMAEMYLKKANNQVVFVIDASASSQVKYDGKTLFNKYKSIARKNIGIKNTIILVKNTPEVVAKDTNPVNALRILTAIRPSDSLSNIWDGMMIGSQITQNARIIVLSDFADTNNKDIITAKKLIEAKGHTVELINPSPRLSNIGITDFFIEDDEVIFNVKNFDNSEREAIVKKTEQYLNFKPYEIIQVDQKVKSGVNKIELITNDNFKVDDTLYLVMPDETDTSVLYISNKRNSFIYSALSSISTLDLKKDQPPIVGVEGQKLFILDEIEYVTLLPGTMESIKQEVYNGAGLIIAAQKGLDQDKLGELLPVKLLGEKIQEITIFNYGINKFEDFSFGLSSRYYQAQLKNNDSIVIAEANDKYNSPMIVLSRYGQGNILYYGIFDDENSFKLNAQYPLFWIYVLDIMLARENYKDLNYKVGNIIYGANIKDPDGNRIKDYTVAEKTGIYKVDNKEIAVNLVNIDESNINKGSIESIGSVDIEMQKAKQNVELLFILIFASIILMLLEVYIIKRRGDI